MSEMIERVAEAIWDARIERGGPGRTLMPWPLYPEADWCRATARAAIEAMREPTEKMLEAGDLPGWDDYVTAGLSKEIWQAMIDAALNPTQS